MYTTFYGLAELPFELSPNPKYLLLTARHREALANLQYGISARKSLTLLIGEAGTGKTTLVNSALASEPCRGARIVHLANPMLTPRRVHRVSGALVRSVAGGPAFEDGDAGRAGAGAAPAAGAGRHHRAGDRRGAVPVDGAARRGAAAVEHRDARPEAAAPGAGRAAGAGRPAEPAVARAAEAARGAPMHARACSTRWRPRRTSPAG